MRTVTREIRLRRLLGISALLPVILALAASLLLAHIVGNLLKRAHWVDHTDQVIAQANGSMESARAMQTDWFAFQVNGQAKSRDTYHQLSQEVQRDFESLQHLVSDNPSQSSRLQDIRAPFNQWSALAGQSMEAQQRQERLSPATLEDLNRLFDQFDNGLDEFVRVEEGLRQTRSQALEQMDRRVRRWRMLILASSGVLLSLIVWRQLASIAALFRASEAAVAERAEILETTLASIGDAVLATDAKGCITFLNSVAKKLTGWGTTETAGKPLDQILDIYDEYTHEPMHDPMSKVLQDGRMVSLSSRTILRVRDGCELSIAASASPIRQRSGKIIGLVLVFRDATEEHRTQRLQARLAAIVKYSDDAIIGKDLDGTMTAWNEGAERMFGYSASEAIGRPITILHPPDRLKEEPPILAALGRGERIDHFETVRVTKDGRAIDVSTTVSPIFDESGRVAGGSTILRNITRSKQDQDALRRARDQLEQRVAERTLELTLANARLQELDRFRAQFLAAMSHELRTPLNSIIGFTEILKEGRAGPVTPKQIQYLGMAHGSARHLLSLINDLLDLSRIEAGRDEVFVEPVDLKEIVEEAFGTVQTAAQAKHLTLESNVNVSKPLHSDRKKLYQILLNLLSNAVKFTDQGKVSLVAGILDGELRVSVSDTGIGMTTEQLAALFGQYQRLENPARRIYEGAGLGLYLCKKLVTLLGGEIWVESERGKGSRFSFKIPTETSIPHSHAKAENTAH